MTSYSKWKPGSNVENVEFRSVFGDMHAHRDAEMTKEHVEFLRAHNTIDEAIAVEMLKPLDKKRMWPKEYIEASPYYTGDEPEMMHFEAAEKLRRKRDQEMLKIVEDYEAGRIDEDGNPIKQVSDGDNPSDCSGLTDIEELKDRLAAHPSTGDKTLAVRTRTSATPSPSLEEESEVVPLKRKRKRPEHVEPLQPLSGGKTYEGYSYNQLAAVGRERGIYTPGNLQGVRNALIRDDINLATGVKRNEAAWKKNIGLYKNFKTPVPDELKEAPEDGGQ